jgi:hypothetical protein
MEFLKEQLELIGIELLALLAKESPRQRIELLLQECDLDFGLRKLRPALGKLGIESGEFRVQLLESRVTLGQLPEQFFFARSTHECLR